MSVRDFIRINELKVIKYGEFVGTFCELFTICLVLFTCQRVYENIWLLRVLTPEMDEIFNEHKDLSHRKPHGVRTCNLISRAPCRCYFVVSKPCYQWCRIAVDSFASPRYYRLQIAAERFCWE